MPYKSAGLHHSLLLFKGKSPIKTKTGTANRWETTNSKALGQIVMIGQSETGSNSQNHIYQSLIWKVIGFVVPFTSLSKLSTNAGPKPIC
jgi:hypothetical protein